MGIKKHTFFLTGEKKISGLNPAEGVMAEDKSVVILGSPDISPEYIQGNSPVNVIEKSNSEILLSEF